MKKPISKQILSAVTSVFFTVTYTLPSFSICTQAIDNLVKPIEEWTSSAVPADAVMDTAEDEAGSRYPAVLLAGKNGHAPDGTPLVVKDDLAQTLQNYTDTYAMGIASQFSVFVEGDFTVTDSDTEGRVAVGGDLTFALPWGTSYSFGKGDYDNRKDLRDVIGNSGFAHIIMNGNLVGNSTFDETYFNQDGWDLNAGMLNRILVINEDDLTEAKTHLNGIDTYVNGNTVGDGWRRLCQAQTYPVQLFDFDEQFALLRDRTQALDNTAQKEGTPVSFETDGAGLVHAVFDAGMLGKTEDNVYFYIPDEDVETFRTTTVVEFRNIPNLSSPHTLYTQDGEETSWNYANIVVDIPKDGIISLGDVTNEKNHGEKYTVVNDTWVSNQPNSSALNNEAGTASILYNMPNAEEVRFSANFQGTVFAPNAKATDEQTALNNGGHGHLSGAIIAQSFNGATEIGFRPYEGTIDILGLSSKYILNASIIDELGDTVDDAILALYQVETDTDGKPVKNADGTVSMEQIATNISSNLTKISVPEEGLYCLKEKTAPAGYALSSTEYYFKVDEGKETEDSYTLSSEKTYNKVYTYEDVLSAESSLTEESSIDDIIAKGYEPIGGKQYTETLNPSLYWNAYMTRDNENVTVNSITFTGTDGKLYTADLSSYEYEEHVAGGSNELGEYSGNLWEIYPNPIAEVTLDVTVPDG